MKKFLFLLCFQAVVLSCNKDQSGLTTWVDSSQVNTYIAGQHDRDAVYWRNGQRTVLRSAKIPYFAAVYDIVVENGIVYTTGLLENLTSDIDDSAFYWIGDIPHHLTDDKRHISPRSIFVSNGDVYVAGFTNEIAGQTMATYWKNGAVVQLTDESSISTANAIAVSGNDVYVAGKVLTGVKYAAICWKNEIPDTIKISNSLDIIGIAVSGNDVYIGGTENKVVKYWKNGTEVIVSDVSVPSTAYGMTLMDNEPVLVGSVTYNGIETATYWKTGQSLYLTGGDLNSRATSVATYKSNLYICGFKQAGNQNFIPKLWINSVESNFDDSVFYTYPYSIFVQPK